VPARAGAQTDADGVPAPGVSGDVHDEYAGALAEEARLRAARGQAAAHAADLAFQVADLDGRIATVQVELQDAQTRAAAAEQRWADANDRLNDTQRRLAEEQQRLRNQAVEAYIGGGAAPAPDLGAALNGTQSFDDLAKSRVYSDVVIADRKTVIANVARLRDEAAQLEDETNEAFEQAAVARDDFASRAADLQSQRDSRVAAQQEAEQAAVQQQLLAFEIEQKRRDYELRYAEMAFQSDGIAQLLAARQKDQPKALFTSGIFLNPVKNGKVVSGYGMRLHPILNVEKMHAGLDIDGPMGEPLRASADGVVVLAEERGGYGNAVVVDHGNQLATLYGHMSAFAVKPGDVVTRGQIIGQVGATGLATGPHCHWEVRVLGLPVDGTPYLSTTPE
jgi:murein DD-endopeptidase MepM/ murein hydrolase activator NlpD